jgi:hypothetical protein
MAVYVYAGLALWLSAAIVLGLNGAYDAAVGALPTATIGSIGLPLLGFAVLYGTSRSFRDFVLDLDIRPLVLIHTWRMLGVGFVFLYFHDILSGWFALPAGLGDAATAVGALFLGVALYDGGTVVSRKMVFWWNTFGLIDFVIAVSMGVIMRPGMGIIDDTLTSAPMGEFPLALIPGFAVPLFIVTHIIIYLQLTHKWSR